MGITTLIIFITTAVSIIAFSRTKTTEDLVFWPYAIKREGQLYRFITHGVLHADTLHLIFNMVSFYSFGSALEEYLYLSLFGETSRAIFSILYATGIVVAVIPDYLKYKDTYNYKSLGASGAVSAVVFAAITIEPNMPILFFFIPFKIPGWIFGLCFLLLSASLARKGGGTIGHNAHFWGGMYGILFTYAMAKLLAGVDLLDNFMRSVL